MINDINSYKLFKDLKNMVKVIENEKSLISKFLVRNI